jgi:hypothetical protein
MKNWNNIFKIIGSVFMLGFLTTINGFSQEVPDGIYYSKPLGLLPLPTVRKLTNVTHKNGTKYLELSGFKNSFDDYEASVMPRYIGRWNNHYDLELVDSCYWFSGYRSVEGFRLIYLNSLKKIILYNVTSEKDAPVTVEIVEVLGLEKKAVKNYVLPTEVKQNIEKLENQIVERTLVFEKKVEDKKNEVKQEEFAESGFSKGAIVETDVTKFIKKVWSFEDRTLIKVAVRSEWNVRKNEYDLPREKYKLIQISYKSTVDGNCYLISNELIKDYEGGGKYGEISIFLGRDQGIQIPCENAK